MLRCNIRGSTGYGQEFRHANRGDFGGKDFADLMTGVDHVIGLGIADPEQLGVMGWSYGGYMTAVAITKTKRFKAASVGAGVSNLISYSGRYFGPGLLSDYLGPLLDKEALFRERSPIFHIKGVQTPTLIQHGELDTNVQVEQGYELYHALKAQKSIVQMVVYRQMDHYPGYVELEKIMQRNLEWFDLHVRRPLPPCRRGRQGQAHHRPSRLAHRSSGEHPCQLSPRYRSRR